MHHLLLRLGGPMAAWGTEGAGDSRRTSDTMPSKSAVAGIVMASMGTPRDDLSAFDRFNELSLSVLGLGPRFLRSEYRTAQPVTIDSRQSPPQTRLDAMERGNVETTLHEHEYIEDGLWIVCLTGDPGYLTEIRESLLKPVWHRFLGRRAHTWALPMEPIIAESDTVEEAIERYPTFGSNAEDRRRGPDRILGYLYNRYRLSGDGLLSWDKDAPVCTVPIASRIRQDVAHGFFPTASRFGQRIEMSANFPFERLMSPRKKASVSLSDAIFA